MFTAWKNICIIIREVHRRGETYLIFFIALHLDVGKFYSAPPWLHSAPKSRWSAIKSMWCATNFCALHAQIFMALYLNKCLCTSLDWPQINIHTFLHWIQGQVSVMCFVCPKWKWKEVLPLQQDWWKNRSAAGGKKEGRQLELWSG